MTTLKLDPTTARRLYPSASGEFKTMLESSFGKEFFSQKVTDRVKTFKDACEVLGIYPEDIISDPAPIDEDAYRKLKVIAKALNEGWEPDWSDHGQYKYYPWFKHVSGVGLSYVDYVNWRSSAVVGSRLCFKSAELAEYAGKQFETIYRDFLSL